jgi:hypothetical protein
VDRREFLGGLVRMHSLAMSSLARSRVYAPRNFVAHCVRHEMYNLYAVVNDRARIVYSCSAELSDVKATKAGRRHLAP